MGEVVVAGRTPAKVEAFATEIGAGIASTYAEAVEAADIVCSCTHSTEPVVRRGWLRLGTHVNAVGFAPGPEIEPSAFVDAVVVVESRDAAIGAYPNGAADLTAAIDECLVDTADVREVGELVTGSRPGRTDERQITIYRSVGVAAQDAAAAGLVLGAARRTGTGTDVKL